ncbi:XRE family transcriptional regulator [Streptomyces sp. NPDC004134]|uniref:XRE family transcriptional regulator n=1 Tax=Streptomyces sp. NPDC004134 TaxID=3364691 RepID=UPI00368C1A79
MTTPTNSYRFGHRVACRRGRRRMTQAHFAALMGKSLRWVEELEAGRVQADPQLSVMLLAASKLGITLERLLSDEAVPCAGQRELDAVRAALHHHDVVTGACGGADEEPVSVELLDRTLAHAHDGFQRGYFAQLGTVLPTLLIDASQAAHHHRGDDQLAAFRLLSLSLELANAALIKWGDNEAAVLAGHRAVAAAERSEDPVTMASAARHLADDMTNHGQAADAIADRLQGELLQRGPDGLSVLGMLYLKAAMAQAAAEADDRRFAALARPITSPRQSSTPNVSGATLSRVRDHVQAVVRPVRRGQAVAGAHDDPEAEIGRRLGGQVQLVLYRRPVDGPARQRLFRLRARGIAEIAPSGKGTSRATAARAATISARTAAPLTKGSQVTGLCATAIRMRSDTRQLYPTPTSPGG